MESNKRSLFRPRGSLGGVINSRGRGAGWWSRLRYAFGQAPLLVLKGSWPEHVWIPVDQFIEHLVRQRGTDPDCFGSCHRERFVRIQRPLTRKYPPTVDANFGENEKT
jgi:hypothetical protein